MTATVVFAPVQVNGGKQREFTQLTVHVDATIFSETKAKHIANGWLLWNVGERVAAGEPELILNGKVMWRFPLRWTSSKQGVLADLAIDLRIDALSGEVIATESTPTEILHCVQTVTRTLQTTNS